MTIAVSVKPMTNHKGAHRSAAVRSPWFLLRGLKWPPAEMQPLVVSPNSWMWKPWRPALMPEASTWVKRQCKHLTRVKKKAYLDGGGAVRRRLGKVSDELEPVLALKNSNSLGHDLFFSPSVYEWETKTVRK